MSKSVVLITGATGFIGFRTLVQLLESGYATRVAIRKVEQEDRIRSASSIQRYSTDVTFITVPDMTAPDAYKTAIQGVQFVVHVASPIPLSPENKALTREGRSWSEVYYDIAVKGTLEILRAAAHEPLVQRVVMTSSGNVLATVVREVGAQATDIRKCPSFDEAVAVETSNQAYKMSKILAITAARDFMRAKQESGGCQFSLVHVCPGYVEGSHELCRNVNELDNTTNDATLDIALGRKLELPNITSQIWVGDVARAHVEALTSEAVHDGDVLVLVGNGGKGWQRSDVAHTIAKRFPKEVERRVLNPVRDLQSIVLGFDSAGTEEKLGWEFKGPEVWATEVVAQYLRLREIEN